jgi:hypothetical protein
MRKWRENDVQHYLVPLTLAGGADATHQLRKDARQAPHVYTKRIVPAADEHLKCSQRPLHATPITDKQACLRRPILQRYYVAAGPPRENGG